MLLPDPVTGVPSVPTAFCFVTCHLASDLSGQCRAATLADLGSLLSLSLFHALTRCLSRSLFLCAGLSRLHVRNRDASMMLAALGLHVPVAPGQRSVTASQRSDGSSPSLMSSQSSSAGVARSVRYWMSDVSMLPHGVSVVALVAQHAHKNHLSLIHTHSMSLSLPSQLLPRLSASLSLRPCVTSVCVMLRCRVCSATRPCRRRLPPHRVP
jgi:hypothetical protein